MTKAEYRRDGKWHYLHVTDHAVGSPQVCAGVSAIVYALAGWLANYGDPDKDTVLLESGEAFFSVDSDREEVGAVFDMAAVGLLQIARAYPEYLRVEVGSAAMGGGRRAEESTQPLSPRCGQLPFTGEP